MEFRDLVCNGDRFGTMVTSDGVCVVTGSVPGPGPSRRVLKVASNSLFGQRFGIQWKHVEIQVEHGGLQTTVFGQIEPGR